MLPRLPGYGSTVWLALSGTIWRGGLASEARGCCWGSPAMAALSGRTWQAPSSMAAWHRQQGGAAGAAQLWPHGPGDIGRLHLAQQPGACGYVALPGQPGYGGTVQPAPAGAVQRSGLAPVAMVCCWGGPAMVARSGWTQRCRLMWQPLTSNEGVLLGRPGYGSTVWLAPAGSIGRSGPAPTVRWHCRSGLTTAAWSDQLLQEPSVAAAKLHW